MEVIWHPDTCDCAIVIDERGAWIRSHATCKLHRDVAFTDKHLPTIQAHQAQFNDPSKYTSKEKKSGKDLDHALKHGYLDNYAQLDWTPADYDIDQQMAKARADECNRIRHS
jgi:hypothetical protein